MELSFALVGPGRVGRGLARILCKSGYRLCGVIGRERSQAVEAAAWISPVATRVAGWADGSNVRHIVSEAGILLITTPDTAIQGVAGRLAAMIGDLYTSLEGETCGTRRVALHTSGALPAAALEPLRDVGYAVGSMHPMESCPTPKEALQRLRGANWGIEGDAAALRVAHELVRVCDGRAFEIAPDRKSLYHAAACVAANYVHALLQVASDWLVASGVGKEEATEAALALMRGAVANAERLGLPAALTGPIERGDVSTVEEHLRALASSAKTLDRTEFYKVLGAETLRIAQAKGHLADGVVHRLESLFQCD